MNRFQTKTETEFADREFYVFGTGFVADMFCRALEEHGLTDHIRAFVVSGNYGTEADRRHVFYGKPVLTVDEYKNRADAPLYIAVHESVLKEVGEILTRRGLRGTWICPQLYSLLYGEPAAEKTEISPDEIIRRQAPGKYWLAVRYGAVRSYIEGTGEGEGPYLRAISLFSSRRTAELRLEALHRLTDDIRTNGFDPEKPILLDEDLRVIDGLHRIALARYLGCASVTCRLYRPSPLYDRVLDERNFLTRVILDSSAFSEKDREWLERMQECLMGKTPR